MTTDPKQFMTTLLTCGLCLSVARHCKAVAPMLHLVWMTTLAGHQPQFVDDTASSCWQQFVAMLSAMEVPVTLEKSRDVTLY